MRTIALIWLLSVAAIAVAQGAVIDTTYRILTYGLPRFEYQNATAIIGEKWGIQHFAVAGCIVTRELLDSVKQENERTLAAIAVRFGPDWEKRFDDEVEREYQRERTIVSKIEALPYIQAKQEAMKAEGNGLHYWIRPIPDGDEVAVNGYGQWNGETEWLVLYVFKVDASGTVTLVNDTPRKE